MIQNLVALLAASLGVLFGSKYISNKVEKDQLKRDITSIKTRHEIEEENSKLTRRELVDKL